MIDLIKQFCFACNLLKIAKATQPQRIMACCVQKYAMLLYTETKAFFQNVIFQFVYRIISC